MNPFARLVDAAIASLGDLRAYAAARVRDRAYDEGVRRIREGYTDMINGRTTLAEGNVRVATGYALVTLGGGYRPRYVSRDTRSPVTAAALRARLAAAMASPEWAQPMNLP